jgi:hypothetical protein
MPPNLSAGPSTPVLDSFTRANGGLGSNWSSPVASGEPALVIVSNQVKPPGTANAGSYWSQRVFDFNAGGVECYMDIILSAAYNCQLVGYMYATGYNYRFVTDANNGRLRLIVAVANADTIVRNTDGVNVSGGGQMWMLVEPTPGNPNALDIYCMYRNSHSGSWTQAFSVYTDSSLVRTSGYIGIRLGVVDAQSIPIVDTFGGGGTAVSNTVVTPPATANMQSVAPVPRVDDSVVSPPATVNAQSVAPLVSIPKTVVSVPAVVTEQSVAPAISGTALVVSPPALFTSAAVAPLAILSPLVLPGAATWTATAVAPGLGRQIISAVGVFTAATTAPGTGNVAAPNAATWTAVIATPVAVASVLPATSVFTASSVAPVVVQGVFTFPNAMAFTALGVSPSFSIIQVLTIPVALWTATAIAPTLIKTIFPNAVVATFSTVAPALSDVLSLTAALTTYTSSAPSFITGAGQSLAVPPATFSAASGAISTSVYVVVPVAQFMPVGITPVLINALAVTVAVVSMSSATPLAIRSPLVAGLAPVVTMRASAPGILTGIGSTAAIFTASAAAPIPSNGQAIPGASFTAVIPSVQFEHAMVPLPIRATFTSAASVSMVVQLPAGGWTAIASSPQLAAQVSPPAGRLTMPSMALTMDIEKKVFADVARWSAQLPLPQMSIKLTSPVPVWVGSPQNHQIGRGTIATPIRADFLSVEPDLAQESMQAIYTYQQGDIVESNAWPMWQH